MGMITYLAGSVAFGNYVKICKSVDPGIAISNTDNLMCKNGTISVNYEKGFPLISECEDCEQQVTIPATLTKREHVECKNLFYDLI